MTEPTTRSRSNFGSRTRQSESRSRSGAKATSPTRKDHNRREVVKRSHGHISDRSPQSRSQRELRETSKESLFTPGSHDRHSLIRDARVNHSSGPSKNTRRLNPALPKTAKSYSNPTDFQSKIFVRRRRFFRLLLAVILVAFIARLVDIQVIHSSQYRAQSASELTTTIQVPPLRGGIYARDGEPLALSLPTEDVYADDFQIKHPLSEASALAPLLGISPAKLLPKLQEHSGYVLLAKQLDQTKSKKIISNAFPGVTLIPDSIREVPNGGLALPVIGFTNGSGAGAAGLEYKYNSLLAGHAGSTTILESPNGVTLPQTPVINPSLSRPGTGIELTLDESLQYETEQALAAEIKSTGAKSGSAIIMDVHTGNILAMASLQATHFNPNSTPASTNASSSSSKGGIGTAAIPIGPTHAVTEAASNLATTQLYEPGSDFKIVTFTAALSNGTITPNSVFTVPDQITLDGSLFHDAEPHPTQPMTATEILAQSSNIGTSEIAQKLGEGPLLAQVKNLGFGSPTGLGFPGDSTGLLVSAAQWEPTDIVSLPIGQVDAVSPLQVLDAYNMAANGGVMVKPRLVQATIGPNGSLKPTPASAERRILTPSISHEFTKMLEQVVIQGTGAKSVIPGYFVAGKTGTSNIPSKTHLGFVPGAFMATFVGYAPANNPTFSAIVVLDRPNNYYGGSAAAPVFSQIVGYALHEYHIPTTPGAPTSRALPANFTPA